MFAFSTRVVDVEKLRNGGVETGESVAELD
jgi:hypothetical protein